MKSIYVAAAIIRNNNKILAAQRGYGEFKGKWEFPGGKIETNESAHDACIREIREELCIKIGNLRQLCTVEHDYDSFHLTMTCFLCSIISGDIKDTEHEDLRWLSRESLWDVDWLPADIKIVELLDKDASALPGDASSND